MEETVIATAEAVRSGRLRAADVVDKALSRIQATNEELIAFVAVDADGARAAAAAVDAQVARGEDPGPLAGVPFGVKDLEDCQGLPTTHGSLLFKDAPPAVKDSLHVARLRAAGAIPIGKTASPEFGMDTITSTKAWGVTRNPWRHDLTPGGSSGGSAAAVSAGMVPFATASDGGGSTRVPASYTGLVGLKPSHGRVPLESESLFTVLGALTTTVSDTARYVDVVAGPHPQDHMSLPEPGISYEQVIETLDVAGLRVGWSTDLGYAVTDPETIDIVHDAAETLIDAAHLQRRNITLKLDNIRTLWRRVNGAELWHWLTEEGFLPDRLNDLGGQPQLSIQSGADVKIEDIYESNKVLAKLRSAVAACFQEVDVLLLPTAACPAFAAEGPPPKVIAGRDSTASGGGSLTFFANASWNPAISVPAGCTRDGLPVGLMIAARHHRDDIVLRLARILEKQRPWPHHPPAYRT